MLKELPLGTVVRPDWSEDYLTKVELTEKERRVAVCGAVKRDGNPCKGRPKQDHGYYCFIHKFTGKLDENPDNTKIPETLKRKQIPILLDDEIQFILGKCNVCPVRAGCKQFTPGHFCRVEERQIKAFFLSVEKDAPDLISTDQFSVLQAAMAYINSWRGRIAQSQFPLIDGEEHKLTWIGPRESKEFRELMKSLGLTRESRLKREIDKGFSPVAPEGVTLADVMAQLHEDGVDGVTVSKTIKLEKKKRDEQIPEYT